MNTAVTKLTKTIGIQNPIMSSTCLIHDDYTSFLPLQIMNNVVFSHEHERGQILHDE